MSNTLTNVMPKVLAKGLVVLRKQLLMPQLVNLGYSDEAKQKQSSIDIPVPKLGTATAVSPGATPITPTDSDFDLVQLKLDKWYHKSFFMTDKDRAQVDKDKHFIPMGVEVAIDALASQVNADIWQQYKGVYGYAGTAGTTPFASDFVVATDTRKVLNKQRCPKPDRRFVLDFDAEAKALNLAPFRDQSQSGDNSPIIEGQIGRKLGFDWFNDDDVPTHTAGTITTGLIAKASTVQAVGLTTIVGTTAASTGACALVVGDIIAISGQSQTYAVTAAATQASAASDVNISITPALKVALAGSETITVKASHVVNLAFNKNAIAFASAPLAAEDDNLGSQILSMRDPVTNLILRLEVMRQNKQTVWDFDILYGSALVRPELACRLAG